MARGPCGLLMKPGNLNHFRPSDRSHFSLWNMKRLGLYDVQLTFQWRRTSRIFTPPIITHVCRDMRQYAMSRYRFVWRTYATWIARGVSMRIRGKTTKPSLGVTRVLEAKYLPLDSSTLRKIPSGFVFRVFQRYNWLNPPRWNGTTHY